MMSCGGNSGLTSGKQCSLEQESARIQVEKNEQKLADEYFKTILPASSPLTIPSTAKVTIQHKEAYDQVKYQWTDGNYKYTSRWHTRTPNAPVSQGDSWGVERHLPGIGSGPNARPSKREILVGKDKWVAKEQWDKAIRARKNNLLTNEQRELLNNGHWNA